MKREVLRMENVTQTIEGVTYLDNVHFHMLQGETMGIIPLNAHGKKQLVDLLYFNSPIDMGRIYLRGNLVNDYKHSNMRRNCVSIIDQEIRLIEDLTISDNIFILRQGIQDYPVHEKALEQSLVNFLATIGITLRLNTYVSELSLFEKYVVELIKATIQRSVLIIFDQLNSFFSVQEMKRFRKLMKYFQLKGFSYLYISHHFEEAFQGCKRVALMENGRIIKIFDSTDNWIQDVKPYMLRFNQPTVRNLANEMPQMLIFHGLCTQNLKNLSFTVRRGECITLLDRQNTGIADLLTVLQGQLKPDGGFIEINGEELEIICMKSALLRGIVIIPENPVENALFYNMSYLENLVFLMDCKITQGLMRKKLLDSVRTEYRQTLGTDIDAVELRTLSRTSLYTLAYYRVYLYAPRVVFLVQPFSNADIYLRRHIVHLIHRLKSKGIAVVILTVGLVDSLLLTDRLFILNVDREIKEYAAEDFHMIQR